MKKLTTILFFLFISTLNFGQDIYIVNGINELKVIDTQDFSITNLFTIELTTAGYIVDLAFAPNGTLYGITGNDTLIEIDLANETWDVIEFLPPSNNYPGLIANANNELITATFLGGDMYVYDIVDQTVTVLGDGFSTPGDFTYYKGNLIFPDVLNGEVLAFDGTNITPAGCSEPQVFAFVNIFTNCDTNTIYGIDENSIVYEYNIETSSRVEVANLFAEVGIIYGGATLNEYMASDCDVVNLSEVDCTLGTSQFNNLKLEIYPNPASSKIVVSSNLNLINSNFTFYNLQGKRVLEGILESTEIDISKLDTGIYFLEMKSANGKIKEIVKLIKQ